ncbi:MAG: hypothetical protein AAF636_27330, partial [Pseudomonadota bacterium]
LPEDGAQVSRQNQDTPPNGPGITAREAVRDLVWGSHPLPGTAFRRTVPSASASGQNRAKRPDI